MLGRTSVFIVSIAVCCSATAQELGPIQNFGEEGRLYSVDAVDEGTQEARLLTKQTYQGEDSRGVMGDVRLMIKYSAGGYEIKLMRYVAACRVADGIPSVIVHEHGEEGTAENFIQIENSVKLPESNKKSAFNLYWAACHGQFQKFK